MQMKQVWQKRDRIIPVLVRPIRNFDRWFAYRTGTALHPNERKLSALKNIHAGKRCFIIGNGPSLRIPDLERLQNDITFASNKIFLAFPETSFRPTYYSVIDTYVFQNNLDEIRKITSFKLLAHYFEGMVPYAEATFFRSVGGFVKGFGDEPIWGKEFYGGHTVVFSQMQLAWYMGIREIYLIGMDHTWHLPKTQPEEYDGFDKVITSTGETNHFHPDYRKPGEKWTYPKVKEQEDAFRIARKYIEQHAGNIFNATRGGALEMFQRVDFDQLF